MIGQIIVHYGLMNQEKLFQCSVVQMMEFFVFQLPIFVDIFKVLEFAKLIKMQNIIL